MSVATDPYAERFDGKDTGRTHHEGDRAMSLGRRHPWAIQGALLLLGAMSVSGWSPLNQVWIAWLAFASLTACLAVSESPWQAFTRGFCFALGFHSAGHGWAFPALLHQTQAGLLGSFVGSALFLGYLSLFLATPSFAAKWILERLSTREVREMHWIGTQLPFAMVFAVMCTAGEALRGIWFNGFDSLAAGYSFSEWPLRGWIPVLGVYGCSLLFYTSAAMTGVVWVVRRTAILRPAAVGGMALLLVTAGGAALDSHSWVQPLGSPLSFRLIQGGAPQKTKFDDDERARQVSAYLHAITAAPADLIVTPETAFPVVLTELNPGVLQRLGSFSTATGSNIFIGAPHLDGLGGIRNSLFHIVPRSSEVPRYDKARLMPFGEYAPTGFAWFTRYMDVALNDQTAGSFEQPPFQAAAHETLVTVDTLMCQEELSTSDARQKTFKAHLFINPGNLAWFAGTLALPQRLQVAQVRALETGRPVLRTTNTGVTAHIDQKGRVLSRLSEDQAAVLQGYAQPTAGFTPYTVYGHWSTGGLAMALLTGAAVLRLRKKGALTD